MLGKMSIGVRRADPTPKIMISSAITMKVYGRRSASLTIPIMIGSRHQRAEKVPSLGKGELDDPDHVRRPGWDRDPDRSAFRPLLAATTVSGPLEALSRAASDVKGARPRATRARGMTKLPGGAGS